MAHEYLFTEPIDGRQPDACRRCATPTTSSTSGEEVGGLCMGGYERDPAPWSLDGVPADFNDRLLAPDWPRFAEIMDGGRAPGPGHRRRRDQPDDQRARGLHPGQRVHPGRERGPRASSSPPASAPTASPAPGGIGRAGGQLDRRRRARARHLEDGHPALRRASTGARPTPWPGRSRSTRPTTTSTTPTRSGRPAGRCAARRPTSGSPSSGRSFGEKCGWERPNWFEPTNELGR